jgi:hypothetical protein
VIGRGTPRIEPWTVVVAVDTGSPSMKPVPEHVGGDVVLLKQQGAMRTGTNLVRFALEENFTNVRVLVNIGRWKHAPADRPFDWRGVDWEGDGRHVDVSTVITPEELQAIHAAMDTGISSTR